MVANAGTQNQTKRTKANMPQHSSIQCGSPTIFKRWEYHGISKISKLFKTGIRASQNRSYHKYYTKTNAVTWL